MEVFLGDIIPTSTVDWPGKVVMTVFFRGCPFRCPFCSNARLLDAESKEPADVENVVAQVDRARDFIDAVVFSGGEPFMQPSAFAAIAAYVKSLGLLVGVQTNGMYPERIGQAAADGLLDAVMLDVKAPLRLEEYSRAAGDVWRSDILAAVKKSVGLCNSLRSSGQLEYYEVRTTVFRGLSDRKKDLVDIVCEIECDAYVLQQGRPEIAMEESVKCLETVPRQELLTLAGHARAVAAPEKVKKVKIRTMELGDEVVTI